MAKRSRRTPAQTRRATPAPGGTDVTVRYIESSELVAALLEADVAARASIRVTDAVLARVRRPFPVEPVRTLDAIHLASIEMLASPPDATVVVTRDARVRANAAAAGFAVE